MTFKISCVYIIYLFSAHTPKALETAYRLIIKKSVMDWRERINWSKENDWPEWAQVIVRYNPVEKEIVKLAWFAWVNENAVKLVLEKFKRGVFDTENDLERLAWQLLCHLIWD